MLINKKPKSYQLTTAVHTHKKNIRNRQKCPMDRGGHSGHSRLRK